MLYNKDWDVKVNPTAKLLREAADLIEKFGHAKRTRRNKSGAMCFLGALEEAGAQPLSGEVEAARATVQYLGLPLGIHTSPLGLIVKWNNESSRTGQEVIDAMRGAADQLQRGEV